MPIRTYDPVFKVDAVYFEKDSLHAVKAFIANDRTLACPILVHGAHMGNPAVYIHGHYGTQVVPMGNWLVRWPTGEYSPFGKEHFETLFVED